MSQFDIMVYVVVQSHSSCSGSHHGSLSTIQPNIVNAPPLYSGMALAISDTIQPNCSNQLV